MRSAIAMLQQEIHQNAKDHGFWEASSNFGDKIALIHSEVSEAFEEYRKGTITLDVLGQYVVQHPYLEYEHDGKPEGIAVELADTVIRILDLAEWLQVDLGHVIRKKMDFNKERPFMHGGKTL